MTVNTVGEYQGKAALETTLRCGRHRVSVINFGGVIRRWQFEANQAFAGQSSPVRDIVLGFDDYEAYPSHSPSFGIMAGRVANRTRHGRFSFNRREYQLSINNGDNHLHGGVGGLGKQVWSLETDGSGRRARLAYLSHDGEEGYPGQVAFTVDYELSEAGLACTMRGMPSEPTPVSLAQHNYYNLDGCCSIRDHRLQIDAPFYLPVDEGQIPTGDTVAVENTRFDFRRQRRISEADPEALGHDHNLVLAHGRDNSVPAAELVSSDGEVRLQVMTAKPGIQLYTAPALTTAVAGFYGHPYGPFAGVCLEAQLPPDVLNSADQAAAIVTPDEPYYQSLMLLVSE